MPFLSIQLTRSPYQKHLPVLSLLEVCHDTVHNVRVRCEDVDRVNIAIRWPPIRDLLDVWSKSGEADD